MAAASTPPSIAIPAPSRRPEGWLRTRVIVYVALLSIALSTGWHYRQAQRIIDARARVADAARLTAQAMTRLQHIAGLTAGLLQPGGPEPAVAPPLRPAGPGETVDAAGARPPSGATEKTIATELEAAIAAAEEFAGRAEALAGTLLRAGDEDGPRLGQAREQVHEARRRMVEAGASLLQQTDAAGRLQPSAAAALRLLERTEQLSRQAARMQGVLLGRANALLVQQASALRWDTGVTLAMLVLALIAIVPALGRLQAQSRRLAQQAAENERLALVAEHTSHLVLITDPEGRIVWVNRAFTRLSGYAADEARGRRPRDLLVAEHTDVQAAEQLEQAFAKGGSARASVLHRARHGALHWLAVDVEPLYNAGGELTGFISVATEITEQVTQQRRSAALLAAMPTAVVVHGPQGEVREANPAAVALLGVQPGDPADRVHGDAPLQEDMQPLATAELPVQRCLASRRGERGTLLGIADGDGRRRWLLVNVEPLRDALGHADGAVACYVDMTERRRLTEQLRDAARRDPLTLMPNRSVVLERVQRAIEHRRRHPGYGFAVLFLDVDRFKQVNDTLGHAAGDELLCQVAVRVEETLRPGDAVARVESQLRTAARIGGDEFVIVLEGIRHLDEACTVAERLLQALARPYRVGSHPVHVSASIGIVAAEQAGEDAGAVLRDCDTAMYEAKRAGRARWAVFDASMHERLRAAVELEGELREALARNALDVAYQPLVDLRSRRLVGVEALARWRHAERGDIPPLQFIPLAEECGLIDALGAQVLAKACAQFARWRGQWGGRAPALLAVNLSRAQLQAPGLVPEVQAMLRVSGMRPEELQLEVTESFAAQDLQVQATLRELKAAGVRLALDDFGTGYSSLACLDQLPVDTVKIDRTFVAHAREVEYHRVLVTATVRVARTLGMTTVAEGIETEDQAALMAELACDRGQGWLFGRPMRAEALERWIEAATEGSVA